MMLRTRMVSTGTAVVLAGALGVLPGAAAASAAPAATPAGMAAAKPAPTTQTVTGTVTNAAGATTIFTGQISNLTASVVNGVLMLSGTLTGTGLPAAGVPFTLPLDLTANRVCTILTLDLGPLDLDLLGLVIELNRVELDITAVSGPGNLLGNLLCAIAGLLDRTGPLTGIAALLNRLLTGLGL